ncbi:MAG TPA: hypothetical protein VL593_19740 [Ramlibacter sp.]|jgi:hypothetical protein|nr:hypothetical protein [Ramlibacter sp.]
MNHNRTASILQRFAVVFAVTAASYGLPQAQAHTRVTGHGNSQHSSPAKADAQKQQQR